MACLLQSLWQREMEEASRRLVTGWLGIERTACARAGIGGKERRMNQPNSHQNEPRQNGPRQNGLAGGVFIAIGLLGGAIIGTIKGQSSIGMVAGLAAGVCAAALVWLYDRNKNR